MVLDGVEKDCSYSQVARAMSGFVILVGTVVLCGWIFHLPVLTQFKMSWASMKPNTALGLILAGIALYANQCDSDGPASANKPWTCALGWFVLAIGCANLYETLLQRPLPIDHLLLTDYLTKTPRIPGRLSNATALSFVFLGSGIAGLDWKFRGRSTPLAQWAAMAVILLSTVAFVGYMYDITNLYRWKGFESIALHTSICLLALAFTLFLSRPGRGWTTFLLSTGPGSVMARRVMVPAMLSPFLIGWIHLQTEHMGWMSARFGIGMAGFASVFLVMGLVLWNARALDEIDRGRRDVEASLRRKEGELFQARKLEAIGRLAGGVAHDFNNILTGIIGMAEGISSELPLDHVHHESSELIVQTASRAAKLTKQLLGFSRQQVANPVTLNVNQAIQSLRPLLSRSLGPDIRVVEKLSSSPAYIRADPTQLEQILLNLAFNARDAMPEGGTLTLSTAIISSETGAYVSWEVADNGTGMNAETLENVFEPFFTTKEVGHGTGLGLATVYGIVKQNGGEITVESTPGEGTVFRILWPQAVKTSEDEQVPAVPATVHAEHKTILVVDDEALVLRYVTDTLRKVGYVVISASSAEEAIQLAHARIHPIDLLLTDVVMPEINGARLARALLHKRPALKVLYMSGYSENVVVERGILKPGISFIEKAFTADQLRRKVHDVLA